MSREPNCLFCKMARGEIAPKKVYEDDRALAFHDIDPQAPVHVLLIPKDHIATANDIDTAHSGAVAHLLSVIPGIARSLGVADSGYRLVINCNHDGQQAVFHLHVHLLGGRAMRWPPG